MAWLLCSDRHGAAAERVGSRSAGLGATVLVSAMSFLLWHYGRLWPGVPDASEGFFTLRQVPSRLPQCVCTCIM